MTNEGAIEVVIKAIHIREPKNGKPKTTLNQYRGFDNKEVGVYDG